MAIDKNDRTVGVGDIVAYCGSVPSHRGLMRVVAITRPEPGADGNRLTMVGFGSRKDLYLSQVRGVSVTLIKSTVSA